MKMVLDIVKTHWLSLVSAVVMIASVTFAFMMAGSTAVVAEMEKAKQQVGASSIGGLRSDPKNEAIIEAEQAKVTRFQAEYKKAEDVASRVNGREPMMDGVFPRPVNLDAPYRFTEEYRRAIRRLPGRMLAGTLPTTADLAEEQQNVEDLLQLIREREEEEAALGGERQPGVRDVSPPPTAPPFGGSRFTPGADGGRRFAGGDGRFGDARFGAAAPPMAQPGGQQFQLTPEQQADPRFNVELRARVSKARGIRLYIDDPDVQAPLGTFDVAPLYASNAPPTPLEMWRAQLSLWIQEDVVEAINALNSRAADALDGDEANVEHMPVKRLRAIRVFGYDRQLEGLTFESLQQSSAGPQTPPEKSLTGLSSNEEYDVVRFRVIAVIDQRNLLALIDEISKQNFYQCIDVSYNAIDRALDEQAGYLYGTAPVVQVTLDFEGYMLRSLYKPLMPPAVRELLGIGEESDSNNP